MLDSKVVAFIELLDIDEFNLYICFEMHLLLYFVSFVLLQFI